MLTPIRVNHSRTKEISNRRLNLTIRKIPEVTKVAARIRALTGEGALMAFTNQVRKGNWADFADIPKITKRARRSKNPTGKKKHIKLLNSGITAVIENKLNVFIP